MNAIFILAPSSRTFTGKGPEHYSDYMLSELLAMHDELIVRLRQEQQEAAGSLAELLAGMIEQHEKDAAQLRALLVDQEADLAGN